jgi:hypothetical protein
MGDRFLLEGVDMSQVTQERSSVQIGSLQVAITVCILAATFMHLYAAIQPNEDFRFWFLPEGLGYLGLFVAFFLPQLAPRHHIISFILAGYSVLTIVLWFVLGQPDEFVGYIMSAIELVLTGMALCEGWRVLRARSVAVV